MAAHGAVWPIPNNPIMKDQAPVLRRVVGGCCLFAERHRSAILAVAILQLSNLLWTD
jgi:hypothetical protein